MASRKPPPKGISAPGRFSRDYERKLGALVVSPLMQGLERALDRIRNEYISAREAIRAIPIDPTLAGKTAIVATRHITALERWHRKRVRETIMKWWGIDGAGIMSETTVRPMMSEFIQRNANLITRLDGDTRAKLVTDIQEAVLARPGDRQAIAVAVRKRMRASASRVRLIARDQTSKAVGQLNHVRQTEAGIERYEWSDSGDERVRPTHIANNGYIFAWNDPPPETGHPGDDISCRCVAIPVMPANPPKR